MQNSLITASNYDPQGIIYGFIGKKLKLAEHRYKGTTQLAQENRNTVLQLLSCSVIPAKAGIQTCKAATIQKELDSRFRGNDIGDRNNIKGESIKLRLSLLKQIHSNKCVLINAHSQLEEEPEADGQVTTQNGIILGVQTADCVPILFIDETNRVIGAAHSGWKGALSGIISNTVAAIKKLGAKEKEITVVIGPCIHQNSYEVSHDFVEKFLQETKENLQFFKALQSSVIASPNKYLFNLPGYIRMKLQQCNLNQIFDVNMDTLQDEANFFSYRRGTLRNEKLDGHVLSIVGLK